jgi:hypothetical protein
MLLLGVAFTLAYGPLTIAATDGTAASEEGLASALLTMSFQFGAAVGLAVVTAVVVAADDVLTLDALRAGLWTTVGAAVFGVLVVASGIRGKVPAPA